MSALPKKNNQNNYYYSKETTQEKKVNLNDLVDRLNLEKKKERKKNILFSTAAISAATVFGIILTL